MSTSGVFLYDLPPQFLRQGPSLNLKLTNSARLLVQHSPRIRLSLAPTASTGVSGTCLYTWLISIKLSWWGSELRSSCWCS